LTRKICDEIKNKRVWNGYDYKLQVWVDNGIIQDCAHPENMDEGGCCIGHTFAGMNILLVPEAEIVLVADRIHGKYMRR